MVVGDLESRTAARTVAEAAIAKNAWQPAARLVPATVLLDTTPDDWTALFCSGFELVSEAKKWGVVILKGLCSERKPWRRGVDIVVRVPVLGRGRAWWDGLTRRFATY